MLLGAHESIAGGLDKAFPRAHDDGCEALQIFSKNANQWEGRPLTDEDTSMFKGAWKDTGIPERAVMIHDSYLINLGNPDAKKWSRAVRFFRHEIERAGQLGVPYLVFHPGAHVGSGERGGIAQIVKALNTVIDETPAHNVMLLLETTAGQGSYLGHTFEQLAEMMSGVEDGPRVGVCYDTCHTFAAGYDIRTPEAYGETFDRFDEIIGLGNLRAFHLNDSLKGLGERVDRHEQIGDGAIGPKGFELLVNDKRFKKMPGVLETPPLASGEGSYKRNLKVLRGLIEK